MDRVLTASWNVLSKTPVGLVTRGLERKFGEMDEISRGLVSGGYVLSTAIYTGAGICFYAGLNDVLFLVVLQLHVPLQLAYYTNQRWAKEMEMKKIIAY